MGRQLGKSIFLMMCGRISVPQRKVKSRSSINDAPDTKEIVAIIDRIQAKGLS